MTMLARLSDSIPQSSLMSMQRRLLSSSARLQQAPRPRATRPASQVGTAIPANVDELVQRYPRHPLLAFFSRESRKVVNPADGKSSEQLVPVAMRVDSLGNNNSGRSWYASELRTKSSLELHQLWYKCLLERNKLATTKAEIQRMGVLRFASIANYNGVRIEGRVRKTMARIKFVLNERRLALLDAQERAAEGTLWGEEQDEQEQGNLFEEVPEEQSAPRSSPSSASV